MKQKSIIFLLVVTLVSLTAIFGCKKTENPTPERPHTDTTPTDTITPEEPPADNIYQFKVLDGQGDSTPTFSVYMTPTRTEASKSSTSPATSLAHRLPAHTTTSTTFAPATTASLSPSLPKST